MASPAPALVELQPLLDALERGPAIPFAAWPDPRVPRAAAGVYTVWRGEELLWVGAAGRGLNEAGVLAAALNRARRGLADRLSGHASGRRSGDPLCLLLADRLVLPALTPAELAQVGRGELSLDDRVRELVRSELAFRFAVTRDGREAAALERAARAGALGPRPRLNPL